VGISGLGARLAIGSLALSVASSVGAQGNLDRGKTAAQLYASDCATCHKSPQSVATTNWIFGLESFLNQHYTSSRESAAVLAAYLRTQEKSSAESQQRGSVIKHASQVKPSESALTFEEEIPRPPADIPDVRR
jgi:hypothetical protein